MKLAKTIAALLFVSIVAACGTSNQTAQLRMDGRVQETLSTGNSRDAAGTVLTVYDCRQPVVDASGKVNRVETMKRGCNAIDGQASIGPTTEGQMAVAAVGGIGAAAVQGVSGIIATKMKADAMVEASSKAQGDTWVIQGGQAVAASNSEATNTNTSTNTNTAKGGQGGRGGTGGSGGNAESNAGAASNANNNTTVKQSGSFGSGSGCGQPVCGKAF